MNISRKNSALVNIDAFRKSALLHNISDNSKIVTYGFSDLVRCQNENQIYRKDGMAPRPQESLIKTKDKGQIVTDCKNKIEKKSRYSSTKLYSGSATSSYNGYTENSGYIENSIIESSVHIGARAIVIDSILGENVTVGCNSIIDNCIINDDVKVGDFCYIGFRCSFAKVKARKIVLGKAIGIPSYTIIVQDCKIPLGTEFSDFVSNKVPGCYHFPEFPSSLFDSMDSKEVLAVEC